MISRLRLTQKLDLPARIFHAVGNVSRLSILYTLSREPMDFGQLVHRLKLSPGLLSHHLTILRDAGLVTKTKFGRLTTYYLKEEAQKYLHAQIRKFLSLQSESD